MIFGSTNNAEERLRTISDNVVANVLFIAEIPCARANLNILGSLAVLQEEQDNLFRCDSPAGMKRNPIPTYLIGRILVVD